MQATDDNGNRRWYVYLPNGKRLVTWAPSRLAVEAKAQARGLKPTKIEPAPPLAAKETP